MRTRLLLSILLLFSFNNLLLAQCPNGTPEPGYTCIPDNNFELALIALGYDSGSPDGKVLTADIDWRTTLDVHSYFISSLVGIEAFAALQTLDCSDNNLIALDLYNNTMLTDINCNDNNIGNGGNQLILPNNNTLTSLRCGGNNLSSLDVSNFPLLDYLACYNNSSNLSALDFTPNPVLRELYCHNSGVMSLNIAGCTLLEKLWCYGNSFANLDISDNTGLIELICYSSGISNFTLSPGSNYNNLTYLDCGDNPIGSLNASKFPNILTLYCYYDNLSSLDVSTNASMTDLDCGGNASLSLTLPNTKTNLNYLWVYDNGLSSLNYDEYTSLLKLDIGINNFTSADVSMLHNLTHFWGNQNQLTILNIANDNIDNMLIMRAQNNATGLCIQVDDLTKAQAKTSPGWQRDPGSTFSLNCSLGLNEFDLSRVSIYPNPAKDKFYIDLQQLEANFTLTNVFGQQVRKGTLISGTNELDSQSLASGIYLLKLETPEGSATKKLIKE